jgi:putative transposase
MTYPRYRKTSHTVYDNKVHLVWTTKYRYRILGAKIARRTRDLMREIAKELDVEIVKGHLSVDHIHMLISIPPYLSISKFVQRIKGKSSRKLQMEFKELQQRYWGKHIWARGYFCASVGIVTDEQIKDYIEHHNEDEDENFTIEKT